MRICIIFFWLLSTVTAVSQGPTPAQSWKSDWTPVQLLPIGTRLYVVTRTGHVRCTMQFADSDSLTCGRKGKVVLQRLDIKTLEVYRQRRSLTEALVLGTVHGAVVGGAGAAFLTAPGAAIYALIDYHHASAKYVLYTSP